MKTTLTKQLTEIVKSSKVLSESVKEDEDRNLSNIDSLLESHIDTKVDELVKDILNDTVDTTE